jgi:hypothetical protein
LLYNLYWLSIWQAHMELKVCTKIVVKVDTLEMLKLTVIGSILLISVGMACGHIFIVPPRYSWNIVSVRRNIYKYMKSSSETRGHILKIAFPPWINSYKVSLLTIFITQIQKFVCEIISSYERFTTLINIWNKTEQQS